MDRDYILPIGTVVKLKKGEQELMVVGRAQLFNNAGTIGYFDYSAALYPQGVISNSEFLFFNDDDIEEVIFEGYRSELEIEFADAYEENISKVTYPKLTLENA